MTQPLALISQPDDEKNHLFLAAYLKPLHDSHMNQGLFLPLSPTIFRKLPSPRQRFYEENDGFFSFFKRVLLNPPRASDAARAGYSHGVEEVRSSLAALEGLEGKKTKLI